MGCLLYTSVTIAYLSMVKIDRTLDKNLDDHQACWIALKDVKTLAFDHNLIIKEAMTYIRQFVEFNPSMLFNCFRANLQLHN